MVFIPLPELPQSLIYAGILPQPKNFIHINGNVCNIIYGITNV